MNLESITFGMDSIQIITSTYVNFPMQHPVSVIHSAGNRGIILDEKLKET